MLTTVTLYLIGLAGSSLSSNLMINTQLWRPDPLALTFAELYFDPHTAVR